MEQLMKLGPFAALSKLWNDLTNAQRAVVAAFVALAIVVGVFTAVILSKPRMSVLFSGLESEDAGAIVQKLSDEKVNYQLSGDGSTIEVPSDKVYDLRLKMATQGLPQGGTVGFELFDKQNFGMTEFTEKLNYQRAIQGELTRTICQLAPVMSARVHIAMPSDKLFSSEQDPKTASVFLKIRRGTPLSDDQVAGIVHLVSSAVEGLKPSNVSVIDSEGNELSQTTDTASGSGGLTTNQSKLKKQYETELAQNLQSMLARIVGSDKAVVRVSADMDFDQKQIASETYEPAANGQTGGQPGNAQSSPAGVLLSQETSSETYNGNVTPPANIPSASARSSASGDKYDRSSTTAQYQVSKRTEETVVAPGKLNRLSVAVLLDDSVKGKQVSAIRQAVTAAAGIDNTRGDQVTVEKVAFDTSSQKKMDKEMANASKMEMIGSIAKNAGAVILLLVFLLFLRSIVKQIKVQAPAPAPVVVKNVEPETIAPIPPVNQPVYAQAEEHLRQAEPTEHNDLPNEVTQSSPEELARLVRTWMMEQ